MKFSILIPVYNVESYLKECFDSVSAQTYSDYEVVVVNDGSTDSSGELCREFAATHPEKVRLVEQGNRGLLLARRVAIAQAQGDYFICLDSDDVLRPDALEVLASKTDETNADIVAFQSSRSASFDEPYFEWTRILKMADDKGRAPLSYIREVLSTSHDFNTMWGKAVRSGCVDREESYDKFEGLQYGEDLLQMAPILDKARSVVLLSDVLYYYRKNPTSISHKVKKSRLRDIESARARLAVYTKRWNPELLPKVYANDGVEVLAYCLMCANRLTKEESIAEIRSACEREFFKNAAAKADFQELPTWKSIGLVLLQEGRFSLFRVYVRTLFGLLRAVGSSKVDRYC